MTWTYEASTHETGNRNVLKVVAGTTENDLSGLIGMTGVTHYVNKNHINVYEIASNIRVVIQGTLYHDPDTEILIIHHDNAGLVAGGQNSTATSAMEIVGNGANPAYYYYGTTRTNSNRGTSTFSKSTGLIFTANRISNWNPADACLGGGGNHSHFVGRGGVILTGRPCTGSMVLDVIGTTWRGITSQLEWRNPFGNELGSFDGTFDGIAVLLPAFNATFNFANSSIGEVINGGNITYHTLREFDVSQNINDYDIGSDGMNGRSHREYEVINSATGTDVVKMWRNTRGSTGQRGVVVTKKEVSFNIKNASGSAINGVKLYLEDNPSAYAKNATFVKSKAYDTTNGYTASGDSPITRGVVNANGDMVYDYTTPETYNKTSDTNGNIAKFEVLTGVQIHEFNTNDSDASTIYGMHIRSNGYWAFSSADNRSPSYSDWDTANFGNFYRVDRRSDSNTNADDFTFKFCSYGHSLSSSTQALKGLGELNINWVLFDDLTISEPDKTKVDAYTEIESPQKFYDRAKAYLTDNYAGELSTIVSRAGNEIDLGSYNLVIDSSASSAFAFDGSTITLKASTFVGNLTTTGTITLTNASVEGTYTDANGTNIILPWSVSNVEATATLQLYNMTKNLEVVNQVVAGVAGTKVSDGGTYTTAQIEAGDNVRLRITCQAGVEAFLPYEAFAVASSAGVSFQADQQPDEVYNANGIDGSAVSTLTADYPNVQIDISDGDGFADSRELYAFAVYQSTTPTGIEKWFNAITAINPMNYRINVDKADIKLQNRGNVPLVITGARIFRSDGTSVLFAEAGDQPMVQDTGELVQYISPQLDNAMTNNTKLDGVSKNTKLIPALL